MNGKVQTMRRTEQIELAKEWKALAMRISILKDELEELGLRQAEIENNFDSDIGTTLYQVLDDVAALSAKSQRSGGMAYHAADKLLDFRRQRPPCGQAQKLLAQAVALQRLAPVGVRRPPPRVIPRRAAAVAQ